MATYADGFSLVVVGIAPTYRNRGGFPMLWIGIAALVLPNLVFLLVAVVIPEMVERAENRGFDRAWDIAVQAQRLGKRLVP